MVKSLYLNSNCIRRKLTVPSIYLIFPLLLKVPSLLYRTFHPLWAHYLYCL